MVTTGPAPTAQPQTKAELDEFVGYFPKTNKPPVTNTESPARPSPAEQLSPSQKWSAQQVSSGVVTWAELDAMKAADEARGREPGKAAMSAAASSSGKSTDSGDFAGDNNPDALSDAVETTGNGATGKERKSSTPRSPSGLEPETETGPATTGERVGPMSETRPFNDGFEVPAETSNESARSPSPGHCSPQPSPPPDEVTDILGVGRQTLGRLSFAYFNYAPYWWLDGYKDPKERKFQTWLATSQDYEIPWYLEEEIRGANLKMRTHIDNPTCSAPGTPRSRSSTKSPIPGRLNMDPSEPIACRRTRAHSLSTGWRFSENWMQDSSGSGPSLLLRSVQDTSFGEEKVQESFVQDQLVSDRASPTSKMPPAPTPRAPKSALSRPTTPENQAQVAVKSATGPPRNAQTKNQSPFILATASKVPKADVPIAAGIMEYAGEGVDSAAASNKKSKKQKQKERDARRYEQALENRRRQEEAKKAQEMEHAKKEELARADDILIKAANGVESLSVSQVATTKRMLASLNDVIV